MNTNNYQDLVYNSDIEKQLGYDNFMFKFSKLILTIREEPNKILIRTDKLGNEFLYEYKDEKYKIYWKQVGKENFVIIKNGANIQSSFNMLNFQTTVNIKIIDT